jgi:hypothetical protein
VRVRLDKKATSISILVALGVLEDGQKELLAIKNMGGESEAAWRALLDDLVKRGLKTPELVIVDGAPGLEKALAASWSDVPVQRCTVHKHRETCPCSKTYPVGESVAPILSRSSKSKFDGLKANRKFLATPKTVQILVAKPYMCDGLFSLDQSRSHSFCERKEFAIKLLRVPAGQGFDQFRTDVAPERMTALSN